MGISNKKPRQIHKTRFRVIVDDVDLVRNRAHDFGKIIDLNPMYPRWAVLILIPTYFYLFYYGKWGYKVENWKK